MTGRRVGSGARGGTRRRCSSGANLYLYAVDRDGQRYKGQTSVVVADPAKKPARTAAVGRVKYQGNWDPEPYGWQRLAAVMHNDYGTDVALKVVDPAADDLAGS